MTDNLKQRRFTVAEGVSSHSKKWVNKEYTWDTFLERLARSTDTGETLAEYKRMPKADRDRVKDTGGFVGAALTAPLRLKKNVESRSLLTLDIDSPDEDFLDEIEYTFPYAGCVYSTHSHFEGHERYRLIAPLTRNCNAEEYQAVARKIAQGIGINQMDHTTYQISRLMYWSSHPTDVEPVFEVLDGDPVDVDAVLGSYTADWHNLMNLPMGDDEKKIVKETQGKKQEDPLAKEGIVGAFCKAYSIADAIDKFLGEVYVEGSVEGRYTYRGGSTANGAVVYEDKWLYSNHATDPCSEQLCNAFDLVRIHLFGNEDPADYQGVVSKRPSYARMVEMCLEDVSVKHVLLEERIRSASQDFAGLNFDDDDEAFGEVAAEDGGAEESDKKWMDTLELTPKGEIVPSIQNHVIILENDPMLRGIAGTNTLSELNEVSGRMPWDGKRRQNKTWTDADDSSLAWYLECVYGIRNRNNMMDALAHINSVRKHDPLQDYINGLPAWDGVDRLDTLLVDFFGASDNAYTRAVTRKCFVGAVARALVPGIKFDYMLTLVGSQGIGKSKLISRIGQRWFSDSMTTVQGKEAYEQLKGVWIMEMSELTATRKADVEAVKQFISKQTDIYRAAYGHHIVERPRHCIFIGTTNDVEFLKDNTGNRRYWAVMLGETDHKLDVFDDLTQDYVDQVLAEAKVRWEEHEPLYLDLREIADMAAVTQSGFTETDIRQGLIEQFLEHKISEDWDSLNTYERRTYLYGDGFSKPAGDGTVERTVVCAAEILAECLGKDLKSTDRKESREINQILANIKGWKRMETPRKFPLYGSQRGFRRE